MISNRNLCPVLCSQCLAADTLAVYGMSEQSRIDERGLQEICPTMIQQLDSQACKTQQDQESETSPRPTAAEGKINWPLRVNAFISVMMLQLYCWSQLTMLLSLYTAWPKVYVHLTFMLNSPVQNAKLP